MNDVWIALGLTLFAGMATGIGSVIAFAAKRTNYRFLSVATGFSEGCGVDKLQLIEGVQLSNMKEFARWTVESDKIMTF